MLQDIPRFSPLYRCCCCCHRRRRSISCNRRSIVVHQSQRVIEKKKKKRWNKEEGEWNVVINTFVCVCLWTSSFCKRKKCINIYFNDILFIPHISRSIKLQKFVFNFIPLIAPDSSNLNDNTQQTGCSVMRRKKMLLYTFNKSRMEHTHQRLFHSGRANTGWHLDYGNFIQITNDLLWIFDQFFSFFLLNGQKTDCHDDKGWKIWVARYIAHSPSCADKRGRAH